VRSAKEVNYGLRTISKENYMPTISQFEPFRKRMATADLPSLFIETFAYYYEQLVAGQTGLISEAEIEPVTDLPDMEELPESLAAVGEAALAKTAVIKLNGGLGTSMGLEQAKSLLPVKQGLSFLDIIARQVQQDGVPLLLMNSFNTQAESLEALVAYGDLSRGLPLSFLQHKAPKVVQSDLTPAEWPDDPELEWCPPGHGDIYTALVTSGTLNALLNAGYEYAFVSNADNLGAVIDRRILGFFAEREAPFLMEVADRTRMDRKGGHLAQRPDGQLILRESAQCPAADEMAFQDIKRHRYFNTNNLWFNLPALQKLLAGQDNQLHLPMIRNEKTVDPRDPDSTPVYQLETAMGSAIGVIAGSQALRVPRSRFAPVKTTEDLLAVRSDLYLLTDDYRVVPNPERTLGEIDVQLDDEHYKFVGQLDSHFPYGAPSLLRCTELALTGSFVFGLDVVCRGVVRLVNEEGTAVVIPDGTVLTE
jgi:UTP--glucose-1-phosphate uridylyltransferase